MKIKDPYEIKNKKNYAVTNPTLLKKFSEFLIIIKTDYDQFIAEFQIQNLNLQMDWYLKKVGKDGIENKQIRKFFYLL